MPSELQHYIPQFLLRRFATNERGQLHIFDKKNDNSFVTKPSKIAAVNNYYDFEFHGETLTLEPALAEIEYKASIHINRIIKDRKLNVLDPVERGELSRFLAVQFVRTPAVEIIFDDLQTRMEKYLRDEGMPDDFFKPDPVIGTGENAKRITMARNIYNAPKDYGSLLAQKDWLLLETDAENPYLIGDHPLTMHNTIERPGRGNLGLKVEGIEIYLPLSPGLMLSLMCPSHCQTLLDGIQRLTKVTETNSELPQELVDGWKGAVDIVEAVQTGKPAKSRPENVEFFNSLQISTAERFIFSSVNDFSLVQDMIQKNNELRHGQRMGEANGKF